LPKLLSLIIFIFSSQIVFIKLTILQFLIIHLLNLNLSFISKWLVYLLIFFIVNIIKIGLLYNYDVIHFKITAFQNNFARTCFSIYIHSNANFLSLA